MANEVVKGTAGVISRFVSKFTDSFMRNLLTTLKTEVNDYLDIAEERLVRMQKQFILRLYVAGLIILGFSFLVISLILYLLNEMRMESYSVFMIVGVGLLLVGILSTVLGAKTA